MSLVCFVIWLVWFIWLVSFNQRNKTNQTNQTDELDGTNQMNKTGWLNVFGILLAGWVGLQLAPLADTNARAESSASQPGGKLKGNAGRGREIFNGKGVCYYCHGIDGHLDRRPRLEADTAALIARLNPPPTDLRNPNALHLRTDKERSRAIREGHPGTGMFPDHTMTDQDLADTLMYLALIRKDPHPGQE
jgi:mono/diheme cytochrome c family protein